MKLKRNTIFNLFLLLLVLLGAIIVVVTYGVGINNFDKHDFLEDIIFAKSSLDSNRLISSTYHFSYTIPFGGNLIMMPFVLLFGPTLLANVCGSFVILLITIYSIYVLADSLYSEKNDKIIFISLVMLFCFTYIGEQFLHHVIYYNICFIAFMGQLGSMINIMNGRNNRYNNVSFVIWLLFGATNGVIPAVLSNCVIIFCYFVYQYLYQDKIDIIKCLKTKTVLLPIFWTIIGLIIYKLVTQGTLNTSVIEERFVFASIENIIDNMSKNFFVDYFSNFYVLTNGISIISITGLGILVQLFFALIILVQPILTIFNWNKMSNNEKLVVLCLTAISTICLGMYSLTVTSNSRYLFNITTSLMTLFAINFKYISKKNLGVSRFVIVCIVLLLLFRNVYTCIKNKQEYNNDVETINVLNEKGLKQGFIKYSNPYYVLSECNIKFINLLVNDSISVYTINETSFYRNIENEDRFFIIIDIEDYEDLNDETKIFLENNIEECIINNQKLYIFDIRYWNTIFEM